MAYSTNLIEKWLFHVIKQISGKLISFFEFSNVFIEQIEHLLWHD